MESVVRHDVVRQFVKFGVVGAMAAVVDCGIYYVLTRHFRYFAGHLTTAKAISFIFAASYSYIWNRRWTFRSDNPDQHAEFAKFFAVATVGLGLNTLLFYLAVHKLKMPDLASLPIIIGIVAVWNFTMNRVWTFNRPAAEAVLEADDVLVSSGRD